MGELAARRVIHRRSARTVDASVVSHSRTKMVLVLYAFVDESYTSDRYYVSALVVDEQELGAIAAGVASAKRYAEGFGIVAGAELHGYEIMSGEGAWEPIRGQHRAAAAIYGRALAEIAAVRGARLFIQGVDVARLNARYRYPEPPHLVALRHVLEDVDRYASACRQGVIVIEDEVPDQADHAHKVAGYQRLTTGGYKPRDLRRIEMPIRFGSSAESPGLQASDLAVYLHRRIDAHVDADSRAAAAADRLWTMLRPLRPVTRRWDP